MSNTLHVHHKIYQRSDPWDVPSSDLITLCESFHAVETFDREEIENRFLRSLKKLGVLTSHLEFMSEYFETINKYFDFLDDEKWLLKEKEHFKEVKDCFICHAKDDLSIYHKSSSYIKKPGELPNSEFDFICKSCNRTNGIPAILCDFLEFLIPAYRHAGDYSEDIMTSIASSPKDSLNSSVSDSPDATGESSFSEVMPISTTKFL